jgi:hypothetical protein
MDGWNYRRMTTMPTSDADRYAQLLQNLAVRIACHPFPAPLETVAELRARLGLAEERLTDLKAMLEDMRRDRDAWREQAQTRLLPAPAAPMSWWRWLRTTG